MDLNTLRDMVRNRIKELIVQHHSEKSNE